MSTDPHNTNQNLNKMKTIIAIVLLVAGCFLASGCVTSYANGGVNRTSFMEGLTNDTKQSLESMTDKEKEVYRIQYAVCQEWFNQPTTTIVRGKLIHDGYQQWHCIKEHGQVKYYEIWIDKNGNIYDTPYSNDGRPIKVPGRDVTLSNK